MNEVNSIPADVLRYTATALYELAIRQREAAVEYPSIDGELLPEAAELLKQAAGAQKVADLYLDLYLQRRDSLDGSGKQRETPVKAKDVLTLWDGWDSPDIFEVREVSSKGRYIASHEMTGQELMESHFSERGLNRFGSYGKGADGTWRHHIEIAAKEAGTA